MDKNNENLEKNKNYNDDIHSLEFWEQPNALKQLESPKAKKELEELEKRFFGN